MTRIVGIKPISNKTRYVIRAQFFPFDIFVMKNAIKINIPVIKMTPEATETIVAA